jgi:transcriptional regulator with AAA-type ATPase domain
MTKKWDDETGGESYKLINEIFSSVPELSTSDDVKKAIEASKGKTIEEREYMDIISAYLNEGRIIGDPKAKERFKEIFFTPLEKYYGYFYVTAFAMQFEGLHDLILSDIERLYQSGAQGPFYGEEGYVQEDFEKPKAKPYVRTKMKELYYHAKFDLPLIVIGQTGCGKELVCRAIYTLSKRRLRPFHEINCAAIPENLLESELFGYEKGAFTDAKEKRIGMFERYNTGTLFLDELGRMPPRLQQKLLKAVDEKEITPLGGKEPVSVDVRCIAAAQPENLKNILPDLKYRLGYPNVFKLPTLNERLSENEEIAENIFSISLQNALTRMGIKNGKFVLSKDSIRVLLAHKHEGNYRELENILTSAVQSKFMNPRSGYEIMPEDLFSMEETADMEEPGISRIYEPLPKDIKLKEIVSYANKVRATIIESFLIDILKNGRDLRSTFLAEGNPPKEYQNFWKKITKLIGKNIRDLNKRAKG